MSARIDRGRVQLLTRTGLDWSDKYPSVVEALAKVGAKTAYLDGELCGMGDDGLPSFSRTQTASDGSRGVCLVYFVFDLLHLDGRDIASLPLIERKALLESLVAAIPGLQFNGHETGDGELIRRHAGQLGLRVAFPKRSTRHMRQATEAYGANQSALIARSSLSSAGPTLKARGRISALSCSATMTTTAS